MNLVNGVRVDAGECGAVLERLDGMILETLKKPPLDVEALIAACDKIVQNVENLEIVKKLPELGVNPALAALYLRQVKDMLGARALRRRLKAELGEFYGGAKTLEYLHSGTKMRQTVAPLGVLFHITAGNVDGLPFLSLLEGLLAGNINIVKLPKAEGGITVSLLEELFKIEPSLKEYVYVFDYSSQDLTAMQKLAKTADAIVIWGGDEAVSAVRKLAGPNVKIIEWGHKISFAYVTKAGMSDQAELKKLAGHICLTGQFFCSSCQGVFLDSDDPLDARRFAESFLPVLDEAAAQYPPGLSETAKLFADAETTLSIYTRDLENRKDSRVKTFKGKTCSVVVLPDNRLEPSIMRGNPWVKLLKREDIVSLRASANRRADLREIRTPGIRESAYKSGDCQNFGRL